MYHPDKLYPEPQTETKHAWDTLEVLAAWLETKPADEEYDYWNINACMFHQYGTHVGARPFGNHKTVCGATFWKIAARYGGPETPDVISKLGPWTFGAAAARCRAEIARRGAP